MKRVLFRKFFLFLLFALLVGCPVQLRADEVRSRIEQLEGISSIEALENSKGFAEKYVVRLRQPLDHQHPEKGAFDQRVIVLHRSTDRPTVIVTEGYTASYALSPRYTEELSEMWNTNIIFVEHRFFEAYPNSKFSAAARGLIFELQDKLVEKEYLSAQLYYNLGDYFGNCTMGGSNYEACIITAQNAIRDYPYTRRKEDFSILILRAKYDLAVRSVESKMNERYNDTIDEYYGFVNEFPKSKYLNEAKKIYDKAKTAIK